MLDPHLVKVFTRPGAHIHIVGIGGAGMSAVARVLLDSGAQVSGSDRQLNDVTHALQHDGAVIYEGHAASNISGAEVVLITSAVKDDNPEIAAAQAAGLPVLKRREFFRYLLPDKQQIAVAGTHGKTTTTALIVHLLREAGRDPSYIVGGTMNNTDDNAHAGKGKFFVVEADEYDYMFLGLTPQIAVVTNIEHDHPDMFPDFADVLEAFRSFIALLPNDGTLITCADSPAAMTLADECRAAGTSVITYDLASENCDWSAHINDPQATTQTEFDVSYIQDGSKHIEHATSALLGHHNVRNALAALAVAAKCGVSIPVVIAALKTFRGTKRRFETLGQAQGVTVISDYGHHPTKIAATLQAARQRYPGRTLWAVWQPHTYSRTRVLANQFAHAFAYANHVLVTDIFAAREHPTESDLSGPDLVKLIRSADHSDANYSGDLQTTAEHLQREVRSGDVVIILSAGDAPKIGELLLTALDA